MKDFNVEKLLVKYYSGETDADEQRLLRAFFSKENVPQHLLADKYVFDFMSAYGNDVPAGLEKRLSDAIAAWDKEEKHRKKRQCRNSVIRIRWINGMVAGVAAIFVAGVLLYNPNPAVQAQDTCATPKEAYEQTQKALVKFSLCLNKGLDKMSEAEETTARINKKVNKQLGLIKISDNETN